MTNLDNIIILTLGCMAALVIVCFGLVIWICSIAMRLEQELATLRKWRTYRDSTKITPWRERL